MLPELATLEMRHVPLENALSFVLLYAAEGSPRFDKGAVRWLARHALEHNCGWLRCNSRSARSYH